MAGGIPSWLNRTKHQTILPRKSHTSKKKGTPVHGMNREGHHSLSGHTGEGAAHPAPACLLCCPCWPAVSITDGLSPSAGRAAPVCVRTAPTDSKSCCCYSNSTQPACCTFLSADCILSSCKMPGASLLWEGGERVGFQSDWTTSCPSATWVWWEKAEWLSVVSYAP